MQWQVAMEGDVSMLIWLGKQYLGQRNNPPIAAADGERLNIQVEWVSPGDKDSRSQTYRAGQPGEVSSRPSRLPSQSSARAPVAPAAYSTPGDQHSSSQAYRLDKPETNGFQPSVNSPAAPLEGPAWLQELLERVR